MRDIELAELAKLTVEMLKEETVYRLLRSDVKYQKKSNEEGFAEQGYLQLDFTNQQRLVCNQLLDCRDSQNLEYSTCFYTAGLYDAFHIMAALFPERWDMERIQKVVAECRKIK